MRHQQVLGGSRSGYYHHNNRFLCECAAFKPLLRSVEFSDNSVLNRGGAVYMYNVGANIGRYVKNSVTSPHIFLRLHL